MHKIIKIFDRRNHIRGVTASNLLNRGRYVINIDHRGGWSVHNNHLVDHDLILDLYCEIYFLRRK